MALTKERVIERYQIGEDIAVELVSRPEPFNDKVFRVKWGQIERGYYTFDAAIVGALALKYDGSNTQADRLICQMLKISGWDK